MKIIIVGLVVNHHSLYQYLLNILIKEFDDITFITKDEIYNQILFSDNNITVVIDNDRLDKVYKNNLSLINEHDVFISDEYFGSFVRLRNIKFLNVKVLFITHNANRWIERIKMPSMTPVLFLEQLFKNKIKKQVDAFITLGPNVMKFMKMNLAEHKNVFWLPFDVANNSTIEKSVKKKEITILVPGTISNLRRNYKDLLRVIRQYYEKHKDARIKFTFLGRIVDENDSFIANEYRVINETYNDRIKYWEHFIDADEFEREILAADYILSNIYPTIINKGIMETYGITKESGISYVIYKYSKPGIVPSFQNILEGFDNQLITFDKYSDLLTVFEQIEKGDINMKELLHNAFLNTKKFNFLLKKESGKLIKYIKTKE